MSTSAQSKVDFRKSLKNLYTASRSIQEVVAPPGSFLAVDGSGPPGGESFQAAVNQLYSVAYTLKFALKHGGVLDFAVPCLECLYTMPEPQATPTSEWTWTLAIRVPDAVTPGQLAEARTEVTKRRSLDVSGVDLRRLEEGRCLQVLHVGPYDEVGPVYEALCARAAEAGLVAAGPAHEVYVSDPRRVPPERLKTVVRIPVR